MTRSPNTHEGFVIPSTSVTFVQTNIVIPSSFAMPVAFFAGSLVYVDKLTDTDDWVNVFHERSFRGKYEPVLAGTRAILLSDILSFWYFQSNEPCEVLVRLPKNRGVMRGWTWTKCIHQALDP